MLKRRYQVAVVAAIAGMSTKAMAQTPPSGDLNTMIVGLKEKAIELGSAIVIFGAIAGVWMMFRAGVQLYYAAETEDNFFARRTENTIGELLVQLFVGLAMSILGIIVGWTSLGWVTAG